MTTRPGRWEHHLRTARRRNRLIESRMGRVQLYALSIVATLALAHIADRATAGIAACRIEQPAQCPEIAR
ncbi:hypothetical protein MB02_01265 [Croceicoccus estronivorus]|uniref:hypothetical protein n=1 Tax=Croceicoccus estronivorus TaxID=1172626 RepID=UPI000836657A|nr:hypothetical protein [Croceicoccus estronivorus]OCC25329.1 hypothetical protein MB02_01265 [Croceicoccus estronivorus]